MTTNRSGRTRRAGERFLVAAPIVLLLALAAGCSEEPTEANSLVSNLPLTGYRTEDTTLEAVSGSSFRAYAAMNGVVNLVGRRGSTLAYTVMQFTTLPARDTATIFSARLTLHAASWYGTFGAPISFTVYRVNQAWSPYTLTWDSLTADFYETVPRGSYTGTIQTDSGSVSIDLDTAMVHEWFRGTPLSSTSQFGFILVPDAATQEAIQGFTEFGAGDSASYYPTLEVIAGSPSGSPRDTTLYAEGIDTFLGFDDHSSASPSLLFVQGGVNYRSVLRFEMSSLPRGAIVNSATLYLTEDPGTTLISKFVTDTALAAHILLDTTETKSFDPEDATTFGRPLAGSPGVFAFSIRRAAQSWIRGPNYGTLIRVPNAGEFSTADVYTFFSPSAPNGAERPRLKVVYSVSY